MIFVRKPVSLSSKKHRNKGHMTMETSIAMETWYNLGYNLIVSRNGGSATLPLTFEE